MEKNLKKPKSTFTATEVGAIVEDLRSQFRAFGDELKSITRRIEGIETTVARTWEKITEIDLRLIRVEKDIAEIKTTLKGHSERLAHLEVIK